MSRSLPPASGSVAGAAGELPSGVERMLVSIVVPVYNEIATVERLLERVARLPLAKEVIVVDDGSTDGTRGLLVELEERGLVDRLLLHDRNRGKGASLRTGMEQAKGDVVVVQDADLEYDPQDLPTLLAPIARGEADAVFGSRFPRPFYRERPTLHLAANKFLTAASNLFTGLGLTDMETCYKVVRADLLRTLPLRANRFGIEPEIASRLAQAGARVRELPIGYRPRDKGAGKKIGWKDGVAALWYIARSSVLGPKAPRWRERAPGE